jgi:hypothetical protein
LAFGLLAIAYPTGCRYSTVPIRRNVPVGQQWREDAGEDVGEIAQKPGRRAFAGPRSVLCYIGTAAHCASMYGFAQRIDAAR